MGCTTSKTTPIIDPQYAKKDKQTNFNNKNEKLNNDYCITSGGP